MARNIVLFVLALQWAATLVKGHQAVGEGCQVSINSGLPIIQPLVINPAGSTDILGYFLPQDGDLVSFETDQEVLLGCPEPPNNVVLTGEPETVVTCVNGSNFRLEDGTVLPFSELACQTSTQTTTKDMQRLCGQPVEMYPIYAIGFNLSNGNFYKTLELCYDHATSDTRYSLLLQTPEISGRQINYPLEEIEFIQNANDGFYPPELNLTYLYTREGQIETLTSILGSSELANQYVNQSEASDYYLTPGHITSELDFVYGAHQAATYWYINTAPQWQTMNVGNWATLEEDIRAYASRRTEPLMVFSGTHGVVTLRDVNGVYQSFYLAPNNSVRVPLLMWKVAFDPFTLRGVALAVLNNPYDSAPGSDFYVCPNVCEQLTWLTWQPDNQTAGLAYCCEVDEFYKTVLECPDLTVSGLLT